jgi:hypothetical protein
MAEGFKRSARGWTETHWDAALNVQSQLSADFIAEEAMPGAAIYASLSPDGVVPEA